MMRGDDVASMQRQLGALGFDAGRPDGVFGALTDSALRDFQRNVGLTDDGICGPGTVLALRRYSTKITGRVIVAGVKERVRLSETPRTLRGWRVAIGEAGGLDGAVEATRRALVQAGATVLPLHDPSEVHQADQANSLSADVYVGLTLDPSLDGCRTSYFLGHNGFYSEGGRNLAEMMHRSLSNKLGLGPRGCSGTRRDALRYTRMPAVMVELGPPSVLVLRAAEMAEALEEALAGWVADPIPEGGISRAKQSG